MKSLKTIIVLLFTISISIASCSKDDETIPTQNNGNVNNNGMTTKMKITIGTAVFTGTLYDNASAKEFMARIPLTIDMKELNGNEKFYDFSSPLSTNASAGGDIKVGDLTLYGNNVLVLFYKNFNTSYSYTKLGYIDNPAGLAEALGKGNVLVKFEHNQN